MRRSACPPGWKVVPLHRLAAIQTGIAKGRKINGAAYQLPYLRVANVQDGFLDLSEVKEIEISKSEIQRFGLKIGDVLFTEGGDFDKLGRGTVWRGEIHPCVHQNHIFVVRADQNSLLSDFLAYQAAAPYGRRYFVLSSKQSTNLASINSTQLKEYPVLLPPITEQWRIVRILRTWDEAVEDIRTLIDNKEREFAALAASLLTGHRRTKGSEGWTRRFLGEVTRAVGARNGNRYGREQVKAVNKIEGMIPMKDHVIAGDLSRYRIVPPRGFAYNPMRLNIGSIAMNEHGGEVLVSPDYVVFEALPGQLDPDFLNHFRRTSRWQRFMEIAGSGSVRVRIYYDDLAQMPLHLPPVDEQRRITGFLNLARREIDLRRAELAGLEKQKRGLMQKLLTGEWRVPVHEGPGGGDDRRGGGARGHLA